MFIAVLKILIQRCIFIFRRVCPASGRGIHQVLAELPVQIGVQVRVLRRGIHRCRTHFRRCRRTYLGRSHRTMDWKVKIQFIFWLVSFDEAMEARILQTWEKTLMIWSCSQFMF